MASAAQAMRRITAQQRRVVQNYARRRRLSHLGWPDLHQTHRFSIDDVGLSAVTHFPDRGRPITWKVRVDRTGDAATGVIATLGAQSSIGFDNGDLMVVLAGESFPGTFIGAPRDDAEIVVAFHPASGGIRAWVDSMLVIAGRHSAPPILWATSGTVALASIVGVAVRSDLDAFDGSIPRHFFEVAVGVPPTLDDILFRATRQGTDLATSRFPYMENP